MAATKVFGAKQTQRRWEELGFKLQKPNIQRVTYREEKQLHRDLLFGSSSPDYGLRNDNEKIFFCKNFCIAMSPTILYKPITTMTFAKSVARHKQRLSFYLFLAPRSPILH